MKGIKTCASVNMSLKLIISFIIFICLNSIAVSALAQNYEPVADP